MTLLFLLLCCVSLYLLFQQQMPTMGKGLSIVISVILSHAFLSFAYSLYLFTQLPYALVICIISVLPLIFIFRRRQSFVSLFTGTKPEKTPLLIWAVFLICLYAFTADFLKISKVWGEWDNWAIWSLHARFLMDGKNFGQLFQAASALSHADYPLMLPSWIAAYWRFSGSANAAVPLFLAWFAGLSMLTTCYLYFQQQQTPFFGLIAVLLLLGQNMLLPCVSFQYADSVLGLFLLLSFVFMEQLKANENWLAACCLGFVVASCGWIKNEGLAFMLFFSVLFLLRYFRQWKTCLYYAIGVCVPLCFIIYFKIIYAVPGDLFAEGSETLLLKLKDPSRYAIIGTYVQEQLRQNNSLLLYLLLATAIFRIRYFVSLPFLTLAGLFCVYLMIYVITPHDLEWHLASSFDRVLHQLVPATVFTILSAFSKKYAITARELNS